MDTLSNFASLTFDSNHSHLHVDRGGTYSAQEEGNLYYASGLNVGDMVTNGNLIVPE